jgi:hypothetical protein
MYCSSCGAAEQVGRFCSQCGHLVNGTSSPAQPAIKNDVNVSVNVGGPTIVQQSEPAALSPGLVKGAVNVFQAARQSRREAAARQAAFDRLRADILAILHSCYDLISEIEGGIQLELLPRSSTTRARYARGLEMQRDATTQLSRHLSESDLHRVHIMAAHALQDFRSVKLELSRGLAPPAANEREVEERPLPDAHSSGE